MDISEAVQDEQGRINNITFEVIHSLLVSNISSFLDSKHLVWFSMMNKQSHTALFDTICSNVTFKMKWLSTFFHYLPKQLLCPFGVNLYLLPLSITHLTFGYTFDEEVNGLPSGLTHLKFGIQFNQPVDHLPPLITHLTFGMRFNQPVGKLPPNITHLTFGYYFNQPVDHLPHKITHLSFGGDFRMCMEHLPSSITHLSFRHRYEKSLEHIPASIQHIDIWDNENNNLKVKHWYWLMHPNKEIPPNLLHLI